MGFEAGQSHINGTNNVMVGALAGKNASTDVEDSVFVGYAAGQNSTGNQNTFVGSKAGFNNSGESNIFIGYKAGYDNQGHVSSDNIFIGAYAGEFSYGDKNIFIGVESGRTNDGVNENVFVGAYTGVNNNGSYNVFLGHSAGRSNTTGHQNLFVGASAGINNTEGYFNTIVGKSAGATQTTADNNVFVGENAGAQTNESELVFVGFNAGKSNTTGTENVFIGRRAGDGNTTGSRNTYIGEEVGVNQVTEDDNVFLFQMFERFPTQVSSNNVFIGEGVGRLNGSANGGGYNTFLGYLAGFSNVGEKNTFFGTNSGRQVSNFDVSENVFIGEFGSGRAIRGAIRYNTYIGSGVGSTGSGSTLGDGNTFIGNNIQVVGGSAGGNNVVIANAIDVAQLPYTSSNFVVSQEYGIPFSVYGDLWLVGEMSSSGNLYVDNQAVQVMSSRMLKKDIIGFEDYEQPLQDILNTPLYHYKYKNKLDYPYKLRMGIISEELPEHLQLKKKNFLSHPDWPSIYGTFWASLKALYERFLGFQEKLSEYIFQFQPGKKNLSDLISQMKEHLENFKKEILNSRESLFSPSGFLKSLTSLKNHRVQLFKDLEQEQEEIIKLQNQIQKAQEKFNLLKQNKTGNSKKALKRLKKERSQDKFEEQERRAVL